MTGAGPAPGASSAPERPSRTIIGIGVVGLVLLVSGVVGAGSTPGSLPWPVQVAVWATFFGLRLDAAQRWLAGGDLRARTGLRVVLGSVLASAALVSSSLPTLVPLGCLLVACVHLDWSWRRAVEAGGVCALVLTALSVVGVSSGLLPVVLDTPKELAFLGLTCMVLINTALLARQRDTTERILQGTRAARDAELLHAARHDALTGLLGRRGTTEVLEEACAAAAPGAVTAVVFCDLDGFKPVNDVHGHDVGDRLLVRVGLRLTEAVGPLGRVGRTGGDEFVVVLAGLPDRAGADAAVARIDGCLDVPVEVDGAVLSIGLSTGLAVSTAPEPAGELLRRADAAMYAVKSARRAARGGLATTDEPTPR